MKTRKSVRLRNFVQEHPGTIDLATAVAIEDALANRRKVHFQLMAGVIDLAKRHQVENVGELLRMVAVYDEEKLRNDDQDLREFLTDASLIIGGHGVESFADNSNEIFFTYVNMGDSYDTTLAHDGDKLLVTSYGDWIEWAENDRRPRLRFR